MAIANLSTLLDRINTYPSVYLVPSYGGGESGSLGSMNIYRDLLGFVTTSVTTAQTFTNTSDGSILKQFPISGTSNINVCNIVGQNQDVPALIWFIDRLTAQGGLAMNTTSVQTTNLPTAALTRYTTGEGVYAFIETSLNLQATQLQFSISYTNQAGTSGRTSPLQFIGGTGWLGSTIPIPLAAGDTGVRSVESLTITGTATTANTFGIALYKVLSCYWMQPGATNNAINLVTGNFFGPATLPYDACLNLMATSTDVISTTSVNPFSMVLTQE